MTKEEIAKLIEETTDIAVEKAEKRSDKRMQRYIGALAEDSKHNIKAVGEQYLGLVKKVDEVKNSVEELKERVIRVESNVIHIEDTVEQIEVVANATFEEVGAMRVELTESNEKLNHHEERITVLEQKVR